MTDVNMTEDDDVSMNNKSNEVYYVESNTYSGLEAQLKFNTWKKI